MSIEQIWNMAVEMFNALGGLGFVGLIVGFYVTTLIFKLIRDFMEGPKVHFRQDFRQTSTSSKHPNDFSWGEFAWRPGKGFRKDE